MLFDRCSRKGEGGEWRIGRAFVVSDTCLRMSIDGWGRVWLSKVYNIGAPCYVLHVWSVLFPGNQPPHDSSRPIKTQPGILPVGLLACPLVLPGNSPIRAVLRFREHNNALLPFNFASGSLCPPSASLRVDCICTRYTVHGTRNWHLGHSPHYVVPQQT